MERVSRLLATGTEAEGRVGKISVSAPVPQTMFFPVLPQLLPRLTTAIGLVGLKHMGCIFGCSFANKVAVFVLVVTGRTDNSRSLLSCLLLLLLS